MTNTHVDAMTFWEHLGELRFRLFKMIIAVCIAAAVAYGFRIQIYDILIAPLLKAEPDITLNYFSPTEPFFIYLKIALFAGLVIASPIVFYQLWAFIAPALKPREKRITKGMIIPVLILFLGGVSFVYFVLLPFGLQFLLSYAHTKLEPELNQDKYFSFITGLCLAGGILFELPVIMALIGWLGIADARFFWQKTSVALVVLMIVAAVITPTGDAFNMLLLTAPLLGLYLIGIVLVWLIQRARREKPPTQGV